MKQLISILLSVATVFAVSAARDVIVVDGVEYTWSASHLGYVATGWDEETPIQALHIHGIVDDLDVVGIADNAFNPDYYPDDDDNSQSLLPPFESVKIDEGVTFIGSNAFVDCTAIRWVRTPSTLATIGDGAFLRCSAMEYALLSEGLTTIGEEAFAFCTSLTMMVIPSTVTDIQAHAFSGCTGVTDVYFLMTDEDQLDNFDWWDGVYASPGEDAHGGMEFNTNASTTVHVPEGTYDIYEDSGKLEAWLFEEDDNCYPLWWIVNFGVEGRSYVVADDLTAVYVDKFGALYAKDDNHWLTPQRVLPDQINYVQSVGLMTHDYDQSNWVAIEGLTTMQIVDLDSHVITGNTLAGTLTQKRNPVFTIAPGCQPRSGEPALYQPNVYIPCSLMGHTQQSIAPTDDDTIEPPTFAFVTPKPQEYALLDRCIYNDDDGRFYISAPDADAGTNLHGLYGGFTVDYSLYQYNNLPELIHGGFYRFHAVCRLTPTQQRSREPDDVTYEPYALGGYSTTHTVFPLVLPDQPIVTALGNVTAQPHTPHQWHTIDGRYCGSSTPTATGIYVGNGKKLIVK